MSNLDVACLKCICEASTGCIENYECNPQGFCGPFFISRKYWEEADKVTLSSDPRYREDGHEDCAKNFQCASKIVANYMAKNGRVRIKPPRRVLHYFPPLFKFFLFFFKDCNNDGITDCDDFARIHFYGEARCENVIENTSYHDRYITCRPPKATEDLSLLQKK